MSAAPTIDAGAVGEEAGLSGLLDTIAARDIRLGVSADRRRLTYDAPRGALTPELRAAIRTHRGELLAALTTTPAPVCEGLHACAWGAPHFSHWRYHPGERRLVCTVCWPELAGECERIEGATLAQEAQELAADRPGASIEKGEAIATRRRAWIARAREDLAAWGEAHNWPRLAIADSANNHAGYTVPFKHVNAGASSWALFLTGVCGADMAAAYRAAGLARSSAGMDRGEEGEKDSQELAGEATQEAPEASARSSRRTGPRGARGAGDTLAVLDRAGLWIERPGEAPACLTDGVPAPSPAIHAGELLALAAQHGITQLWIHPSWALDPATGLPSRLPPGVKPSEGIPHAFTDGAIAAGWDMRPAAVAPWLHCFRRGTYGAIALVLPHLETRAPWRTARDGRELLGALLAYREGLAGYAYRHSPGATGTGLLRSVHSGNRVALDLSASASPLDFPAPARAGHAAPDLITTRLLTGEELATCAYVGAYDKNAMYLGACAALPLGLGAPEHIEGEGLTFDKRLAGYWRARIAYAPPPGLPNLFAAPLHVVDADGYGWYLSPTIELAYQEGAAIELQEAYVWRSSHRIMAPWYERMRDGRALLLDRASAGDPAAAIASGALKCTRTQAIGWLNGGWLRRSEAPEDLYRPDWRDGVMAQAAANLYRELLKVQRETGRTPFAVDTDCAYFASAIADAAADIPAPLIVGTGLRHVKVKVNGAPLAPVAAILDRLSGTGASANRILDEIQAELATHAASNPGASRGSSAQEEA